MLQRCQRQTSSGDSAELVKGGFCLHSWLSLAVVKQGLIFYVDGYLHIADFDKNIFTNKLQDHGTTNFNYDWHFTNPLKSNCCHNKGTIFKYVNSNNYPMPCAHAKPQLKPASYEREPRFQ